MTESIVQRVRRLLSASIQDSVDAMERANSDGVMREAVREVDRAIDEVRTDQQKAMTRRLQAARQQDMITKKLADLTDKARFALGQGREDLAEGAPRRQVDLEGQIGELEQTQLTAKEEEDKLDESLAALRARKTQLQEALSAFVAARTSSALGGDKGLSNAIETERKVERAEAAFNRAMTDAGGNRIEVGDVSAINQVAEIDQLQRGASVAARLAALKQDMAAAAAS